MDDYRTHLSTLSLYTRDSVKDVSLTKYHQTKERMNGVEEMDVALTNTIGEDAECPGIGSSQIPTIRSLSKSCDQDSIT
jgi:hypothetical protein